MREAQERRDSAVRLVLASIDADHPVAAQILKAELDGDDKGEQKLFVAEVANIAEAFAVRWQSGARPSAPVRELLRAMLDGTQAGLFEAAATVTRPPAPRTRAGRRALARKRK